MLYIYNVNQDEVVGKLPERTASALLLAKTTGYRGVWSSLKAVMITEFVAQLPCRFCSWHNFYVTRMNAGKFSK